MVASTENTPFWVAWKRLARNALAWSRPLRPITNNSSIPATDLAFTIDLPGGIEIADPANPVDGCDGTLTLSNLDPELRERTLVVREHWVSCDFVHARNSRDAF